MAPYSPMMPQMEQMPQNTARPISGLPPLGQPSGYGRANPRTNITRALMAQGSTPPALGRMPDIPQLGAGGLATPPGVTGGMQQQAGVGLPGGQRPGVLPGMGALPSSPQGLLGGQGLLGQQNLLQQPPIPGDGTTY